MKKNPFLKSVSQFPNVHSRLVQPISSYLLGLGLSARKHSQTFAAEVSGLNRAQFSRLLKNHRELATNALIETAKKELKRVIGKKLRPLTSGVPWTVGIIIDSTLHGRASEKPQNAQTLSHGRGFVDGHEWTNVMILVNGKAVPIPPIPFYTRKECKRRGIPYKTEIESVMDFLREFQIWEWVGYVRPEEVVVIVDGGYDAAKLQRFIVYTKGWDFVGRVHSNRSVQRYEPEFARQWLSVKRQFEVVTKSESPWETVRLPTTEPGKKRRDLRIRQLLLILRGSGAVQVVCSDRNRDGFCYLVSNNIKVMPGALCRVYRMRWLVEVFHRSTKSYLGLEHAGVWEFDSLQAHVHWVYCTYILMMGEAQWRETIHDLQGRLGRAVQAQRLRELIQQTTHYGGLKKIRRKFQRDLDRLEAA